jgi:hypothetical protein
MLPLIPFFLNLSCKMNNTMYSYLHVVNTCAHMRIDFILNLLRTISEVVMGG